jgi:hypothetical protein
MGAGTGHVAMRLLENFEAVVALEPDVRMLAQIEPRPTLTAVNARAEDARFEPERFDLVTAGNAFHWMDGALVLERVRDWLVEGGRLALFRYNPPHAASGALEKLLAHEYDVVWRAHVDARLRDPDYARRTLAESSFGRDMSFQRIPNDLTLTRQELIGFLRSTSYGGGYARTRPDPDGYWRELEARVVRAAGEGPFVLDFHVELLQATKVAQS